MSELSCSDFIIDGKLQDAGRRVTHEELQTTANEQLKLLSKKILKGEFQGEYWIKLFLLDRGAALRGQTILRNLRIFDGTATQEELQKKAEEEAWLIRASEHLKNNPLPSWGGCQGFDDDDD